MNRSVLLGLFITASMMASTSFAAEDQCAVNLQTIENNKADFQGSGLAESIKATVEQAKADHAKGTKAGTDACVAETNDLIQSMKDAKKGGNG
ncbi:hypothetical protein [Pseudomonas sp. GL-B-19]|uniref:hypothetical protein n=1 Tax=Pseudomonas sp. GL-B-19 TaxID=2832393 RepID=UPI001CBF2A7B|nr:hypothetical protein [Pseudomonas sp. GL-B-19]